MKFVHRYLPQITSALIIAFFGMLMLPPQDAEGDFRYHDFGRLPVLEDGRYKPMDTVARNSLMILTQRQGFSYDDPVAKEKRYISANHWMLDVMTAHDADNSPAWDYQIFRVDHDELVNSHLKLPWREGLRFSFKELGPSFPIIAKQAQLADNTPAALRTLLQMKFLELTHHLGMVQRYAQLALPAVVPGNAPGRAWQSLIDAARDHRDGLGQNPEAAETLDVYAQLLTLYPKGDKAGFNDVLTRHLARLEKESPGLMRKINTEVFLNDFSPFLWCRWVYILIALIAAGSWLPTAWSPQLQRAGFWGMLITFVVHTGAICIRMYLQGKPPVTNLYSSAIFIGWACAGVCLIVEWFFRYSLATAVGSVTAAGTLIIAHLLSLDGETMPMLVAVLDTNFWLATHVTCISLGYMTAIVAGFMGVAYILLGMFTDKLRGKWAADLTSMTYGVLCAGMFLSFVGTVLGGLWADYSWGRFWGWDPKENGALLIVIWIALILHARWGGMVKQRGIAVLSTIGIIVTAWSWFGTNFLGIGKHAYGGSQANAMLGLIIFDFVVLGIAGIGLFPLEMWKSFAPAVKPGPPPTGPVSTAIKPA